MSNPQMQEFSGRLRRIEKIHRQGGGFEAVGTLGQSYYTGLRQERRPLLRPAVVFVAVILVFKGFLLASIGETAYAEKIAHLRTGGIADQVGGYVMAVDPVTLTIAEVVKPLFN